MISFWLALACGGKTTPPAPVTPPPVASAEPSAQAGRMASVSGALYTLVDGVVREGTTEQQGQAEQLALWVEGEDPAIFGAGRAPMIAGLRAADQAPHVTAYATALARVAQACGDCHQATNGGPAVPAERIPAQVWGDASHMVKHRWAVDWLWVGLVSGDEAAWRRGGEALADIPDWRGTGDARPDWVGPFEVHVRDLIRQAPTTPKEARPELYGQIIAACAECHQRR